jgi:hypothetical protein
MVNNSDIEKLLEKFFAPEPSTFPCIIVLNMSSSPISFRFAFHGKHEDC